MGGRIDFKLLNFFNDISGIYIKQLKLLNFIAPLSDTQAFIRIRRIHIGNIATNPKHSAFEFMVVTCSANPPYRTRVFYVGFPSRYVRKQSILHIHWVSQCRKYNSPMKRSPHPDDRKAMNLLLVI